MAQKVEEKPVKLDARSRDVIERAIKAIRTYPDTVDMANWVEHDPATPGAEGGGNAAPYCGTTACLAGHLALAATGRHPDDADSMRTGNPKYLYDKLPRWLQKKVRAVWASLPYHGERVAVGTIGLAILGQKTTEKWDSLFHASNWPTRYANQYASGNDARSNAKAVIGRIRYYLRTGK